MGTIKRIALAGLVAVATSAPALAADLLPPPPPMAPPIPVDVGSGWYLRGDVGVGILDFDTFKGVDFVDGVVQPPPPGGFRLDSKSVGDQVFVGIGVGYQFNNWLRADITGEYRTQAHLRTIESFDNPDNPRARGFNLVTAPLSSFVGLVNGYVDLGTYYGLMPFVGAGVGFAHHELNGVNDQGLGSAVGGIGIAQDRSDTRFAWALHAGLGYAVTPNLKLELAYRFLHMDKAQTTVVCSCNTLTTAYTYKDLTSHDIKLGMRWMFNTAVAAPLAMAEPVPEPAPAPIIRKY